MNGRRLDNGRYGSCFSHKLTKEFLTEEYVIKHRSPYTIAYDIGCHPRVVYNYLKIYNIETNHNSLNIQPKQEFGYLTILELAGSNKYGKKWLCQCRCGKQVSVLATRLISNRTKSCGCYKKRHKNHKWKGYGDISGNRLAEIRLRASKKNIPFNLTCEILWNKWLEQNGKCAISGLDISLDKNASLDRIDSSEGYVPDNVWWTHKDVNKMKMDIPYLQFLNYCKIVYLFQNKKGD